MISAIILAAGESSRMDSFPKANLKYKGKTFLACIVDLYVHAGIVEIIVVVGKDSGAIIEENNALKCEFIENEDYRLGQLSSIHKGLDRISKDSSGVFIHPVDMPLVRNSTVTGLKVDFENNPSNIILPKYNNKKGHPVIFSKTFYDQLKKAPHDTGARKVVWDNGDKLIETDTDDPGILININTPVDFNKFCLSCSAVK